eukprot:COSAG06_NODE_1941_length_8015_cov_2.703007_3_plen_81_part_00
MNARGLYTNCFQTEMRLLLETHRGVSSRLLGRPFEPVAESELHTEQEQDGTETNENGDAEEGEVRPWCCFQSLFYNKNDH